MKNVLLSRVESLLLCTYFNWVKYLETLYKCEVNVGKGLVVANHDTTNGRNYEKWAILYLIPKNVKNRFKS